MSDEHGDDDPQLKSLRAVWLSLPDEDPPERGLAELMAAARIKAEQMTKPSLWQRIIALLRRPPVFALATVLILIGGVVFLGQRRDKMEAEPTYERAKDTAVSTGSAAVATPPATEPPSEPGEDRGYEGASAGAAEVPTVKLDDDKPLEQAPPATPAPEPKRKTRPAVERAPASGTTVRPSPPRGVAAPIDSPDKLGVKAGTATNLEKESLHGAGGGGGAGVIGGTTRDDSIREETTATDSFAAPPPQAAPEPAKPTTASPPRQSTQKPMRAPQYIAQAKSAAARGDCTAARLLMKRVMSEDITAYRKALASDAALNKCVVAAQ